jgi:hypothetical protein
MEKDSQRLETMDEKPIIVQQETLHAHNANLAQVLQEHKPNQWGAGYIKLYFTCLLIYLCSTMNGMSHRTIC